MSHKCRCSNNSGGVFTRVAGQQVPLPEYLGRLKNATYPTTEAHRAAVRALKEAGDINGAIELARAGENLIYDFPRLFELEVWENLIKHLK